MTSNQPASTRFRDNAMWISAGIFVVALVAWELLSRAEIIRVLFFPPPSKIATTLVEMIASGELVPNLASTLSRMVIGTLVGGIPGMLLGWMMGWNDRLKAILDPFIAAVHPIPKIALFPLIVVIFGIGEASRVVLVAIAAFFPMLINTILGVHEISPVHFDVARNYGARARHVFLRVVVPGSLPAVLTGARLALNNALLLTISAELISSDVGLGRIIWLGWQTLRTDKLYVGLVVTAVLGIGINLGVHYASLRMVPWQEKREQA